MTNTLTADFYSFKLSATCFNSKNLKNKVLHKLWIILFQKIKELSFLCSSLHSEAGLLTRHPYDRYNHFFQAHAAMLKRISVVVYEMIVIIRITKKNIFLGKYER